MRNIQFEKDIETIPQIFKTLKIIQSDTESYLKGELPIIDSHSVLWDSYQVEIRGSESYPLRFPKLFETADYFPKNADWHVYEDDLSCCVDILPSEVLICRGGLNVHEYIKRFAIPYFANQSFRMREGYYLYGEYSHGVLGKIEYYQNKLTAKSPKQMIQMLRFIINGVQLDRTAFCPFCSRTKFRKCHRSVFAELSKIKELIAMDVFGQLIPFFNAYPNYKLAK